jgi:hypothetical protein
MLDVLQIVLLFCILGFAAACLSVTITAAIPCLLIGYALGLHVKYGIGAALLIGCTITLGRFLMVLRARWAAVVME